MEEKKRKAHPWVGHGLFTSEEKRKAQEKLSSKVNDSSKEKAPKGSCRTI